MIKKKIIKDEFSLNAIIALPKSEFIIPCKIPPGGILEFGYGFLNEFARGNEGNTERIINFKIILKNSEEEKTLLQRSLSTAIQKEDILSEKMDLSSYGRKKVKLSFITEEASSGSSVDLTSIPVWINPVIYRRPEKDKTNIILISIDTLRPDHLGCYGYERNTSPHTDRLAKDGVLFSNTFSTTSWTLPAHISLLASQDSLTHQVYYPNQKMNSSTTTLADILRMKGYYCAAFTGGAYLSTNYGFSKGFDSYHEIISKGSKPIRLDEAEHLARLSCDWLDKNKDKKFFLFLHTYQPHGPYSNNSPFGKVFLTEHSKWDKVAVGPIIEGKGRYITEFSEEEKKNIVDLYDGEIRYTDEVLIKPLIDKLKELNMYDSTMVIFTSDHGEEFYDHEAWLHDHSIYNEGIKIPLIIKFPNYHHKGKKINYITRITDIMPTILAQLKIQTSTLRLDGKSLLPLIEGKEKKDRIFISDLAFRDINIEIYPALISINNGSLKFILNKKVKSSYTKRKCKDFNGKKIELYDIRKDPKETKNLALHREYQELCVKLLKKIDELYENGEKERKEGEEVRLNKKLKERLKALGYIK
jgi:arylsulfatase A-like enzyme